MSWTLYPKCPYFYQWQLADWAIKRWPDTPVYKFKQKSKKQLYAIWYRVARGQDPVLNVE